MLCCRAFTLLELLLVLVVLGVLAALAAARLGGMRAGQGLEQATQIVLDQAQRGQHLAASRAEPVRLRLDHATRTTAVQLIATATASDPQDGQPAQSTLYDGAEELTVAFTRDDGIPTTSDFIDLVFLPDSRCDPPGNIIVTCAGRSATVHCFAGAQAPTRVATP